MSPNVLAAGRGRSIGRVSPTPHSPTPSIIASGPSSTAVLANGMLQLRVNTSVRSPPQVVPSKFSIGSSVCGRHPRALVGERGLQVEHAVLQADAGREDLERRARHVALLVRVPEQRIARRRVVEREHGSGGLEVRVGDEVGVVAGEAPHRLHRPGGRLDHDHRALTLAQRVAGDLLQVVADRHPHRCRSRRLR